MIANLTRESFEPHIGTGFAISSEGYDDVLTLVAVNASKPNGFPGREPFNLLLHGGRTDVMYNPLLFTLTHPEMGELELGMSPIGKNDDGTFVYQIVFN